MQVLGVRICRIMVRMKRLSPKERRVLVLFLRGASNERIANEMRISPYSVRVFLQNAAEKLGMDYPEKG